MKYDDLFLQEQLWVMRELVYKTRKFIEKEMSLDGCNIKFNITTKTRDHKEDKIVIGFMTHDNIHDIFNVELINAYELFNGKDVRWFIGQTLKTIIHEYRHIQQFMEDVDIFSEKDIPYSERTFEIDADTFANQFIEIHADIIKPIVKEIFNKVTIK